MRPAETAPVRYCELHCRTNFSFLEGASHPDELVAEAARLGYAGIAVTDRNSLGGCGPRSSRSQGGWSEAGDRSGNHPG